MRSGQWRYQWRFSPNTQEVEKKNKISPRIYIKTVSEPSYFFYLEFLCVLIYIRYIQLTVTPFYLTVDLKSRFLKSHIYSVWWFSWYSMPLSRGSRQDDPIPHPKGVAANFLGCLHESSPWSHGDCHRISWWHPGTKRKFSVYISSQAGTFSIALSLILLSLVLSDGHP